MRSSQEAVPKVVRFLATHVGIDSTLFVRYAWEGRTIEAHRAQIRAITKLREFCRADVCTPLGFFSPPHNLNQGKGNYVAMRSLFQEGHRDMDDVAHLLNHARQGHSEALSTLYRRFLPGIFGYIVTRVPDRTIAEDLTSEVFLQMVEGIHALRATDEASFAAWLLRIARMTVAGYYRKRERQPALLSLSHNETQQEPWIVEESHPETDPVFQAETREEWNRVVQAINHLTEDQRQVLVGRLLMGYDVETVARLIGKKGNAVKALQFRALQSLHRLLAKQEGSRRVDQKHAEVVR